jgi:hypothetical protein
MSRYEVILSVVVEAETTDEAYAAAIEGQWASGETIVEEDGIRILPDPVFALTEQGLAALKENA